MTVVLLLFSSRAGALAADRPAPADDDRPARCRGGPAAHAPDRRRRVLVFDVLPATVVFGAGMALVVAPLTSAVLDSAPDNLVGSASGVNNAVARAGGLLAVAVIPGLAGIGGADYADPAVFNAGFRAAIVIAASLLVAASALAFMGMQRRRTPTRREDPIRIEEYTQCPISGPAVHPMPSPHHD